MSCGEEQKTGREGGWRERERLKAEAKEWKGVEDAREMKQQQQKKSICCEWSI